jgi:hypothetical protein
LKAGLWFRRGLFVMRSPVHGNLRRVQAEFPLIRVVQISRASSQQSHRSSCIDIGALSKMRLESAATTRFIDRLTNMQHPALPARSTNHLWRIDAGGA